MMTEYEPLRDELTRRRREIDQQRQEALLAREAVRQAARALEQQVRTDDPHRQEGAHAWRKH